MTTIEQKVLDLDERRERYVVGVFERIEFVKGEFPHALRSTARSTDSAGRHLPADEAGTETAFHHQTRMATWGAGRAALANPILERLRSNPR
jgi:hypothetical protein